MVLVDSWDRTASGKWEVGAAPEDKCLLETGLEDLWVLEAGQVDKWDPVVDPRVKWA